MIDTYVTSICAAIFVSGLAVGCICSNVRLHRDRNHWRREAKDAEHAFKRECSENVRLEADLSTLRNRIAAGLLTAEERSAYSRAMGAIGNARRPVKEAV